MKGIYFALAVWMAFSSVYTVNGIVQSISGFTQKIASVETVEAQQLP